MTAEALSARSSLRRLNSVLRMGGESDGDDRASYASIAMRFHYVARTRRGLLFHEAVINAGFCGALLLDALFEGLVWPSSNSVVDKPVRTQAAGCPDVVDAWLNRHDLVTIRIIVATAESIEARSAYAEWRTDSGVRRCFKSELRSIAGGALSDERSIVLAVLAYGAGLLGPSTRSAPMEDIERRCPTHYETLRAILDRMAETQFAVLTTRARLFY